MEQDPDKVASQYDAVAGEYAERFCDEHDKKVLDREMLYKFSKEVADRRPVWDFGCGPGQTAAYLKSLGIKISGLDLSEKMIGQARIIHPDIGFRKGNILDLEFEDNSIAGIVAFYAIVHFSEEQVKQAFNEIFRVLQPAGLLLLTFHVGDEKIHVNEFLGKEVNLDFIFFKTDFICHCLEESGFEKIEAIERDPYPDVEYQSRRAYVFAKKPKHLSPKEQI